MKTIMWHKNRLLIALGISIIAYMMFKTKKYSLEEEIVLPNTKAEIVWEFVADFSNVKKFLIPHMKNFTILSESGNYDHWQYSVAYEEPLPVWPYFDSSGLGHYTIRIDKDVYIISSVHKTCLFSGWSCFKSVNDFYIKQASNKQDTKYKEKIVYECPPIFSHWCTYTAEYTRKDFIKNLKNYFEKPHGHMH